MGATDLTIPAPAGYAAVTPEMKQYAQMLARFVAPQNEHYVSFIPEQDAMQAREGKIPVVDRWFSVQTPKAVVHLTTPIRQFAELKKLLKEQNQEIQKKWNLRCRGSWKK